MVTDQDLSLEVVEGEMPEYGSIMKEVREMILNKGVNIGSKSVKAGHLYFRQLLNFCERVLEYDVAKTPGEKRMKSVGAKMRIAVDLKDPNYFKNGVNALQDRIKIRYLEDKEHKMFQAKILLVDIGLSFSVDRDLSISNNKDFKTKVLRKVWEQILTEGLLIKDDVQGNIEIYHYF